MEDIPKIVQQRLAVPPPSSHPDADLLNAFGENALNQRDRLEILQHLAICADCREVIALSAPQQELEMVAAVGAAPMPLSISASAEEDYRPRRSFNLRWGTVAALAVIVMGALVVAYRPMKKTSTVAPESLPSENRVELPMAEMRAGRQQDGQLDAQLRQPLKSKAEPEQKRATAGSSFAGSMAANTSRALPAAPRRSKTELNALAKKNAEQSQVQEPLSHIADSVNVAGGVPAGPPPPPPPPPGKDTEAADSLAYQKPASGPRTAAAQALPGVSEDREKSVFSRVSALSSQHWRLSNGKLQRSLDAGKTWQVIEIENNPNLRALSVSGKELWVGGAKGALYHSSDDGEHWVHMIASTQEQALTDDIVRIDFTDADHGKLITSHNVTWSTDNCGATWQTQ